MKYEGLIGLIDSDITTNGAGGITGAKMNSVLNAMVSALGDGYRIGGVIHTDSIAPTDPENGLCYIAADEGTYTNFGNVARRGDELALVYYKNNTDKWQKMSVESRTFGYVLRSSENQSYFDANEYAEVCKDFAIINDELTGVLYYKAYTTDERVVFLTIPSVYMDGDPITYLMIGQTSLIVDVSADGSGRHLVSSYDETTGTYLSDAIDEKLSLKQDTLTFDGTPTANSTNPVTSGGIATALGNKADKVRGATNDNLAALDTSGNLKDSGYKPSDFAAKNKSVPPGGTTGQVLAKKSNTDNDLKWVNQSVGSATDVQVNGTSITSNGVANIVTETAYNASSNKIATMSDVPDVTDCIRTSLTAGLVKNDGTIDTTQYGTYSKPSGGIPASDLASGVIPSVPVTDVTVGGTSVVSSGTAVIPSIPTVPTISTNVATDKADNTKTASPKAVYDEVHPTLGSSEPSGGFLPNVVYNVGALSGNTTFTMAAASDNTILNHWYWMFDTPSTAPTITWPAAILEWASGSAPTINASKHYEVSVIGGLACILETGIPTAQS